MPQGLISLQPPILRSPQPLLCTAGPLRGDRLRNPQACIVLRASPKFRLHFPGQIVPPAAIRSSASFPCFQPGRTQSHRPHLDLHLLPASVVRPSPPSKNSNKHSSTSSLKSLRLQGVTMDDLLRFTRTSKSNRAPFPPSLSLGRQQTLPVQLCNLLPRV